jgi:hypothetical protein
MTKHDLAELNKLYTEGDEADKETYAEMRSNVLLISGEFYNKKAARFNNRIRDSKEIPDTQKLRITKNHIHKIVRYYTTNILAYSPNVSVMPKNPTELQDQKEAELNQAVWQDACIKHRFQEKRREFVNDFVGVSECAAKVFFDPNRGEFKGYEAKLQSDEEGNTLVDEMGNPIPEMDESGQMVPDESKPRFAGDFVIERLHAFNIFRPISSKSMREAPWLGLRKMVETKYLKELYSENEEVAKKIVESPKDDYVVFDSSRGEYAKSKDQTLVKEIYFRPCFQYPLGYFYIFTDEVILSEGELPYGIFPIVWAGFDEHPTKPRASSIVKVARPYVAEISRAASQMATHQITIGDDKIIYQAGTKLAPGTLLPGVRGLTYQGSQPQILPGRDGSQFLPYIESQIKELYSVVDMDEENQETPNQMEPYTMLYMSMKHRKKFSTYGEKFEQFLKDLCEVYLELAKKYLPDDALIYAIGKSEQINIPEFRATTKLCYEIKLEAQNDNMETALGKQLTFQHILQYASGSLDKKDIGKLIKLMPFGNHEEGFEDLTMDYDNAKNEVLSLDRGTPGLMPKYEDQGYIVKKLTTRMNKPDFQFLPQEVQQLYAQRLQEHENVLEQQVQKIQAAKDGFIPSGGALVACDLYLPAKNPDAAAKRARIPYESLQWLVKRLETQGLAQDNLEQMNQAAVADMAGQLMQQNQQTQRMPMTPNANPLGGGMVSRAASPVGVN